MDASICHLYALHYRERQRILWNIANWRPMWCEALASHQSIYNYQLLSFFIILHFHRMSRAEEYFILSRSLQCFRWFCFNGPVQMVRAKNEEDEKKSQNKMSFYSLYFQSFETNHFNGLKECKTVSVSHLHVQPHAQSDVSGERMFVYSLNLWRRKANSLNKSHSFLHRFSQRLR